jgi:hypothetical protein
MTLEEMVLRSELKREETLPEEVERLVDTIRRRLEDAGHQEIHPETRLEQAYHAILGCALVGLRVHGLRPTDRPGRHVVALESMIDTLGLSIDRIDYFQTLRALRNKDLYTGGCHISDAEAREAVEEARRLADEVRAWLAEREEGPSLGS